MTDNRETIAMLKMLKEQALKSHNDTAVLEVKIESFNFVLDEAIKALEQQPCEDAVSRDCDKCAYYDDGANHEACDECFADEYEHPNFKPKAQPCNDCISRQAVLDINENHHGQMPNHVNHEIWNEIKALPSVTPKEKTAEWYEENGCEGACDGYMSAGVICSQCGEVFCGYIGDYNFCPNCGARMQEVEE